jgi:DNA-binding IclR family transcriptional regulator
MSDIERISSYLQSRPDGASGAEIERDLTLTPSQVNALVTTLEREGKVKCNYKHPKLPNYRWMRVRWLG